MEDNSYQISPKCQQLEFAEKFLSHGSKIVFCSPNFRNRVIDFDIKIGQIVRESTGEG